MSVGNYTEQIERTEPEAVVLFGILFHNVTFQGALEWAIRRMREGKPAVIATVNVDFVMQAWEDADLHETLLEADLVVADGAPIVGLSSRFGPQLRERVTGSDLTPILARACAKEDFGIYLLGAGPGVALKAGRVLCEQNPRLRIVGCHSPPVSPLSKMKHSDILRQLEAAQPHLLLVALGAPKQEKFIRQNLPYWKVPIAIGVGGTLDFLAGVQWRAPTLVQKIGMEWLWRLATDPTRLLRRYHLNLAFLVSALVRLLFLKLRGLIASDFLHDAGASLQEDFERLDARLVELEHLGKLEARDCRMRWILVNLGRRHWLESGELAQLVAFARDFRRIGGRFSVLCPSKTLENFFRVCHLDRFIHIFATAQEALFKIKKTSLDVGPK